MPTRKHSVIQSRLGFCILSRYPQFEPASELTVRIRTGRFLVPDLAVQSRDNIQDPYPLDPIHLCVEILSPEDRMSDTFSKCEEYHAWGVANVWIIDPEERRAWEYKSGHRPSEVPPEGSLTAGAISVSLAELFERL
jgi:Uma2 family endonuclease